MTSRRHSQRFERRGAAGSWAGGLLMAVAGCASLPPRQAVVDSLHLYGNHALATSDIEDQIATQGNSRFLGIFAGVFYDYQVFNRYVLQNDLQRIERYYRARGFYEARVRAAHIRYDGHSHVRVDIHIDEGSPVAVSTISLRGTSGLPRDVRAASTRAVRQHLRIGDRFEEANFAAAASALTRSLTDSGYAYAKVTRRARVDVPGHFARLEFGVEAGAQARVGAVHMTDLGPIPEGPVAAAMNLQPGVPYSARSLDEARQAALELGVFGSVEVTPELPEHPTPPFEVPVRVVAQPTRLHTASLGVGLRLDTVRADVHLTGGWEDRNFLGGLRRLTLQAGPGLVLYPTRLPTLELPRRGLPELSLRAELRQPGFLEPRTSGFTSAEFDIYSVLFAEQTSGKTLPGYRQAAFDVGLDRSFARHFYARLDHRLQLSAPFSYVGALDDNLNRSLILSYPELLLVLDLRDDHVEPSAGGYFALTLQAAGVGGDARDTRIQPEVRGYVPLLRGVTLTARATIGLLFPRNYSPPDPTTASREYVRNTELLFFRGFFSGGPSSNRGYPPRGVGPQGSLPFFYPNQGAQDIAASCVAGLQSCSLPLGGFSLWEASTELRIKVAASVSVALFCDASDVGPRTNDFQFAKPNLSCGPGLRYATPLGPIRADLGVRVPGLQVATGSDATLPTLLGLPAGFAVAIGESF